MVKEVATFTKYAGIVDADDPKSLAFKDEVESRLRAGITRKIKHTGDKPRDYDIEFVYYQSYEDDDMPDDGTQATMGAVYFPEPIFSNSLPVVLVACRATEKVTP